MLTKVVLNSSEPKTLLIDSVDPDSSIILKSISGLGPVDVTLFSGEYARSGGYYQGRRTSKRNPVFNLKLNADYKNDISISSLREELYRTFLEPTMDGDGLQVLLYDDELPVRYFVGYTEKLDPDIFEKTTDGTVSMLSFDPNLFSLDPVLVSEPAGFTTLPMNYEGSAKTGLELDITVKTATTKIVMDVNGVKMVLDAALTSLGTFAVNDVINISTRPGNLFVRRNGVDVMALLTSASKWLQLRHGANTIKVYGTNENDGRAVMTAYRYRAEWWGV